MARVRFDGGGVTAALVYGRRMASKGALYAIAQVLRRAWQLYVAHIFLFVDARSHSVTDTLYDIYPYWLPTLVALGWIADRTGGRPANPVARQPR